MENLQFKYLSNVLLETDKPYPASWDIWKCNKYKSVCISSVNWLTLKHSCVTLVYQPSLTYLKPWHHALSGAVYATLLGSTSTLPLSRCRHRRRADSAIGACANHNKFCNGSRNVPLAENPVVVYCDASY